MSPRGSIVYSFYEKVGIAAWLMTKSKDYAQYPTACLAAWIEPAVLHDQIHFFFGEDGKPAGYLTWARLEADTEQRLLEDPDVLFHISEWNEGNRLWIMDLVLISGNIRDYIALVRTMFPDETYVKSMRRNDDGTIRKIVVWHQRKAP